MANSHFSKPMSLRTNKMHFRPIEKKKIILNMASYTLTKSKNQEKKNQARTMEKIQIWPTTIIHSIPNLEAE